MTVALHCCWLLAVRAPDRIAVVPLDDSPSIAAAIEYVVAQQQAAGSVVLSQASLTSKLTGMSELENPDETALSQMLADARNQEAHFDDQGANGLRQQIVHAFDLAIYPSAALRVLAGQAGLDMAAALLTKGQREEAARVAKQTWRRFGSTPIDTIRHSPETVAFLESQRQAVASHDHKVQLTVISSRSGILFADGTRLGEVHGRLSVQLPQGHYRIWLEWQGGMSLPYLVHLSMAPVEVTIDVELEEHIDIDHFVAVRCQQDCSAVLVALGKRLEVARVIGVGAAMPDATNAARDQRLRLIEVDASTGQTSESVIGLDGRWPEEVTSVEQVEQPMASFSPLYLIPFGGGQLAQDRPYFALGYLGVQLSLLAGYVWVHSQHPNDLDDLSRERKLNQQKDLVLGLFIAAAVASVVEAVVVGLMFGE